MSYGWGTEEFYMGRQGFHPDWDDPDFNWAAYQAGVGAANAARAADAADNGWPTSSGGGVPFVFRARDFGGTNDGSGALFVIVALLLYGLVVFIMQFFWQLLFIAAVAAVIYLLWQIPEERYVAAWDWLAARVKRGIGWTQRQAQVLHAKANAAHRAFVRWRRHSTAQRRGRPLPAVERIRRR